MTPAQPEALRIAELLNSHAKNGTCTNCDEEREAATELLRLRAENKALRASHGQAPAGARADSVQEDAARWNVWSQVIVEWVNCDTEPKFLRVLSGVLGDTEPPITLQQLNAWTDAARAAQKKGE